MTQPTWKEEIKEMRSGLVVDTNPATFYINVSEEALISFIQSAIDTELERQKDLIVMELEELKKDWKAWHKDKNNDDLSHSFGRISGLIEAINKIKEV